MAGLVDIILGPPGSGKSEQASRLAASHRYVQISTGALLRASNDSAIKATIDSGELESSEVVEKVLLAAIEQIDASLPILLDGFPRLKAEAKWLDQALNKLGRELGHIFVINVTEAEALKRLESRGRSDDPKAVIKHRWQEYTTQTEPVISSYRHDGRLIEIEGAGTPEEVAERIAASL
ncbi:MAG TPA: nucleoside monophosphate kinase [Candidatus Saccharimonadales bacterium]|nr:nucleoside monophosphate kinase [Candidatus Saccharimonadales bacterium]